MQRSNDNTDGFILLTKWMRKELHLKDKHLIVYGLIYGFSQDGQSEFYGSLSYIADWVGASPDTIRRVLKDLVSWNLIRRREEFQNGVMFVRYSANLSAVTLARYGCEFQPPSNLLYTPLQNANTPLANCNPSPSKMQGNNKEENKKKEKIKVNKSDRPDDVTEEVWAGFLENRKLKRASYSTLVITRIKNEAAKIGMSLNDALTEMVVNNWQGFKAEWVKNKTSSSWGNAGRKTEAERNFDEIPF